MALGTASTSERTRQQQEHQKELEASRSGNGLHLAVASPPAAGLETPGNGRSSQAAL
jgi:hypothetical protein